MPPSKFVSRTHHHEPHSSLFARIRSQLAKAEVVIVRCTREYMTAFAEYEEWLSCGAIVITSTRTFVVGLEDTAAAIESMRVHYAKNPEDLCGCGICDGPDRDIACFRCWNGVCKRCFARTHVNSRSDPEIWRCPFCRDVTDVDGVTRNLPYVLRASGKKALAAIRDTMLALGVNETELNVSGKIVDEHEIVGYHDRSLTVTLRAPRPNGGGNGAAGGRRRRRPMRVWLETEHSGLVMELLQTPRTVFLVGVIPHLCDNVECDVLHGHPDEGRAYMVSSAGEALEMVEMFGPVSARIRAWDV